MRVIKRLSQHEIPQPVRGPANELSEPTQVVRIEVTSDTDLQPEERRCGYAFQDVKNWVCMLLVRMEVNPDKER